MCHISLPSANPSTRYLLPNFVDFVENVTVDSPVVAVHQCGDWDRQTDKTVNDTSHNRATPQSRQFE